MLASGAAAYVWEDPGDSIMIQINLDVIERLGAAVEEGLGVSGRGFEIGGILLGQSRPGNSRVIVIDDFEVIPSQHLRGASYTLSPKDRQALGARLERRKRGQVVGYFRSHTRPGLYLDQDDFSVISSYFPDPSNVFLVIRPSAEGPATGGFFFWEEGEMNRRSSYRQFPLDRERLMRGDFPVTERHAVTAAQRPLPAPAVERVEPAPFRLPHVPWLVVPIFAGCFLVAGLFVSQIRDSRQAATTVSPSAPSRSLLSLDVQRTGSGLEVRWDPSAAAIRKADLGVLWITDGNQQFRRELDAKELAAGNTSYVTSSRDVNFELQVFTLTDKSRTSVGSEAPAQPLPPTQVAQDPTPSQSDVPRANGAVVPAPVASAPAGPVPVASVPATSLTGPATAGSTKMSSADRTGLKPVPKRPADKVLVPPVSVPTESARVAPREVEAPPALEVPTGQPKLTSVLPSNAALPPPPVAEISSAAPRASTFKRVLHRISSFGDAPAPQGFVPPSPIHKVKPATPSGVQEQGSVDVKVYVDETGKVSRAQLLTKGSDFGGSALSAARQWQFAPARKRDKPVASEVVLHFQFGGEM